jgi:hypothetical protein
MFGGAEEKCEEIYANKNIWAEDRIREQEAEINTALYDSLSVALQPL